MDKISKEVDEWYIPLFVESGDQYYFKGHGLDKSKIEHYLKEEYGEDFTKLEINETWGHYGWANYDGEKERWLFPNKKYKGVRGGFKITEIILLA
jgi:hypothetical protein